MKLHNNKQWLLEQHNKGLSQRDIAKLAGVSTPTIRAAFKKFGIEPRSVSESLTIKKQPRHKWTDQERKLHSLKMKKIMEDNKELRTKWAKRNWEKNRQSLLKGIKQAGLKRRKQLNNDQIIEMLHTHTMKDVAKHFKSSLGTIRRIIRDRKIENLQEYKRLKLDLPLIIKMRSDQYSCKEIGEYFGCDQNTIIRFLNSNNISTEFTTTDKFRSKISNITKEHWKDDDYRHKMAIIRSNTNRISGIQNQLYDILSDLNIEFEKEYVVGPFSFDCFLPEHNLLIECNGDYWNSIDKTVSNDLNKMSYINNYKLKAIWEHEFKDETKIINLIKYWCGLDRQDIIDYNFNDLQIKSITSEQYKTFLSKYHYLIYANRGGLAYGAFLDDNLIAVIIFSPLVRNNLPFNNETTLELSRLCVHPDYQKKNLCSWFISRTLKLLPSNISFIISYSDSTYNHSGAVYKASNFKLHHVSKPSYWYVNQNGWVIHKKTIYNRARKLGSTEKEYVYKNKLIKVNGKEKYCFTYDLTK